MRADEPDVDHAIGIVDPHHYPILVAGDIEYHTGGMVRLPEYW
jgi:hypothetical protein